MPQLTHLPALPVLTAASMALLLTASACSGRNVPGATGGAGGTDKGCVDVEEEPGLVNTEYGAVRGEVLGGTYAFKGIPFAAPPVGDLRFRPPEAPKCWNGERNATAFGARCVQHDLLGQQVLGQEDCLTLNVWAPNDKSATPLPVMVYFHGGSNVRGSSSEMFEDAPFFNGQPLVEQADVVVVTFNYRVGAFGFLAHAALSHEDSHGSSGNYALLDQIAALSWVQSNIAGFRGDPKRVMVFGESAGAIDICALVASPLAKGLFSRALMQSGACVSQPLAAREAYGEIFADAVECTGSDVAACLREQDPSVLLAAYPAIELEAVGLGGLEFGPTVDGHVLTGDPLTIIGAGKHNDVPLAIGTNADESALFQAAATVTPDEYEQKLVDAYSSADVAAILSVYPKPATSPAAKAQLIALDSDVKYTCPSRLAARAAANSQTSPVFRYWFTEVVNKPLSFPKGLGAFHGLELYYLFQHGQVPGFPGQPPVALERAEKQLGSDMLGYWTRFATDGDPNGGSGAEWPAYDVTTDTYLDLNETPGSGEGIRTAECDVLDNVTPL